MTGSHQVVHQQPGAGGNAWLLQNPSPDATAAFFRSEVSRMARRVKQSGLKLD